MKLATVRIHDQSSVAIVDADGLTARLVSNGEFRDVLHLIQTYGCHNLEDLPRGETLAFDAVEFCAPIPRPTRNIFCVGKNYRDHASEFSRSGFDASTVAGDVQPQFPVVFTKATTTVIGPGAPIPSHPDVTCMLDFEAELAVVIGSGGSNISAEDAFSHILGYTIINDVTARDLQKNHKQWFLGKSLDGFCPMGPWMVTPDELDITQLSLRCWVNEELRQQSDTSQLIFNVPTLVETLSRGLTLLPGDIITTGTPAGVGIGSDPPRFLKAGDTVAIEVEGLGRLVNSVT